MRLLAVALLLALPAPGQYDILIRNARVIDGGGNPWFRADIGVKEIGRASCRERV